MTNFTLDNQPYQADSETLKVLQSIIPAAHAAGDYSAVIAVLTAGLQTGRIVRA